MPTEHDLSSSSIAKNHSRIHRLVHWYEHRLAPIAFVIGFIFDWFTLTRADYWMDHAFLIGHLVISGTSIILLNAFEAGRLEKSFIYQYTWLLPFTMQFSFGGLFSGFVSLYARSGSVWGSGIFLASLVALMVGNELLRERYRHMFLHVAVYVVVLNAYLILAIPTLLREIGLRTFLLSDLVACIAIALFLTLLFWVVPERVRQSWRSLFAIIGAILIFYNVLYFTNVIPPIPLSLRELDVYHSITRTSTGAFQGEYEQRAWYDFLHETSTHYTWTPGTPIYVYSSIFAPTRLSTDVFHHWLYFDEATRTWLEKAVVPFTIFGGRNGGYRGYSFKTAIAPGKWRVDVRTDRGQLLGRTTFTVIESNAAPLLQTRDLE